jgi:hypothetical protein
MQYTIFLLLASIMYLFTVALLAIPMTIMALANAFHFLYLYLTCASFVSCFFLGQIVPSNTETLPLPMAMAFSPYAMLIIAKTIGELREF